MLYGLLVFAEMLRRYAYGVYGLSEFETLVWVWACLSLVAGFILLIAFRYFSDVYDDRRMFHYMLVSYILGVALIMLFFVVYFYPMPKTVLFELFGVVTGKEYYMRNIFSNCTTQTSKSIRQYYTHCWCNTHSNYIIVGVCKICTNNRHDNESASPHRILRTKI